jgi:ribose 5-phosphate isomerase A
VSDDALKRAAAARAAGLVRSGMRLGLGTGSTARHFVDIVGAMVREGLDIVAVPTSEATARQAVALGIRLTTLDETPALDLAVDGADEIDPALRLIKGGGGAHLREKIVANAAARFVVIADETKLVDTLGRFPLPIEVVPFGLGATRRAVAAAIRGAGAEGALALRETAGAAFVTDSGNVILDARLGRIADPEALARRLDGVPGVVEHGLFIGMAEAAIVATASGLRLIGRLD